MGMDKEATDLWRFGRPRPDLTAQETWEASQVEREALAPEEDARRDALLAAHNEKRFQELKKRAPEFIALARSRAAIS